METVLGIYKYVKKPYSDQAVLYSRLLLQPVAIMLENLLKILSLHKAYCSERNTLRFWFL
jgi:hypothetical protein